MNKIEWCDRTINIGAGCDKISAGCANCYAIPIAHRFPDHPKFSGLTRKTKSGIEWTGRVNIDEGALDKIASLKKPSRIFLNSMGDLFHHGMPSLFLEKLFRVMGGHPRHTFIILTKRPNQMREWLETYVVRNRETLEVWPLPNVWLGVSVESMDHVWRIQELLKIRARVRLVSAEPLLAPLQLTPYLGADKINWVITGGESGPKARPSDPNWFREVRDDCQASKVSYFHKQNGEFLQMVDVGGWVEYTEQVQEEILRRYVRAISGPTMIRVGKKRAGRMLDGVEHNEFPEVK
ncbi:DUF5131 family protein [Nitrospina gracilis]|uniref:DUF5131 family protein n=1 Tax=Nitrospina gracilis TaxID=35801 RepID=UPI001F291B91|nr:phage Gp37/Gp68 family protein [Nitrospina gracilis]MCF8719240.1 protein gp37 [Nitrospina gracilis Nb-211]